MQKSVRRAVVVVLPYVTDEQFADLEHDFVQAGYENVRHNIKFKNMRLKLIT